MELEKKCRTTAAWSDLLPVILESIFLRLSSIDRASFRFVCKSWRSVAETLPFHLDHDPVRLMILRQSPDRRKRAGFYSLRRQGFMEMELPEEFISWRCCGHFDGWLAMVSDEKFSIVVLHLLSNAQVRLPCNITSQFSSTPKYADQMLSCVKKVILSSSPLAKNCTIAALGEGSCIALYRPGSKTWNSLDTRCTSIEDMIIFQGKLFVLSFDGTLFIYRLDSFPRSTSMSVVLPGPDLVRESKSIHKKRYLVESSDELLVVSGDYASIEGYVSFHLFKLDLNRWIPISSLGNQALFVGLIKSESITISDANRLFLKENHIYFVRKSIDFLVPHAMGVFGVQNESVKSIPIAKEHSLDYEPIWINSFL